MTTTISNSIKLICPGFYKITVKSRKGEDSTSGKTGGKGGIAQAIFYFNSQTLVQYAVGAQTYIRLYENDGYIDPLFTTKGNDATTSANGSNGSKTVLKRDYILEASLSTNNTTTSQVLIVYLGEQI